MNIVKLSEIKTQETFTVADIEFIKFYEKDGKVGAVSRDILFNSVFGKNNNNFAKSIILKRLQEEILPKIIAAVGEENICEFVTDLRTLDGLKPYPALKSKISIPTLDFYRDYVDTFDMYKVDDYFHLATPNSAQPHTSATLHLCVSPLGFINYFDGNYYDIGVRPFFIFESSLSVSDGKEE